MSLNNLFNNKQVEVLKFSREHKPWLMIQEGCIRTGKSILNDWLFLLHVNEFLDQDRQFIITGKTIGSIERNILQDWRTMLGLKVHLDKFNSFQLLGNTVRCFGSDTREAYKGLSGFTAHGWLANEVTYHETEAIKEAIGRCSGDGARIFWDCNPDAPNHTVKQDYIDKADNKIIASFHWMLEDNAKENGGFLTREYINNLKNTTPAGVWYDRKILGLWTSAEGMIYKDWNPDKMVVDQPRYGDLTYYAGVDWGYDHLGCIVVIAEDSDGNIYIVDEIADTGQTIDWWKQQQKYIIQKYGYIPFYCDSARPEYVKEFNGIEAKKDVVEGIEHIASLMKRGKFFLLRNTGRQFQKEIYLYRWDTRSAKEQPIKDNDDCLDAVRYAIYTHSKARVTPAYSTINAINNNKDFQY